MARRSIVVGFDGTPTATRAMSFAALLAAKQDARVRVVHVVDWSPLEIGGADGFTARAEQFRHEVQLDREKLFPPISKAFEDEGVEAIAVSRSGNPVNELIAEAEACEALAIVVGRRGGSSVEQMLVGSVARGLVNLAHGPVIVVP